MSRSHECCGWKSWAELAGMDAEGRPIAPRRPEPPTTPRDDTAREPAPGGWLALLARVVRAPGHGRVA